MMATVDKMPMLQEGYEKLQADLKRLKEERPQIVDAIEEARAHGDLSENAEYHAAKERQGQIEASIAQLEDRLSRAQIIDPKDLSGDKIVFGATVTLLDDEDKPVRYQIVGETEADAKVGRISFNSPLGRALIGRKKGDEVEVTVPSGDRYYLVDKIEFV
jgi:transcription elongation factor GreA